MFCYAMPEGSPLTRTHSTTIASTSNKNDAEVGVIEEAAFDGLVWSGPG